ncbi:hypothetical protein BJ508DRAFT_24778 [Ascobolus immersus RN42]|uniref:Uncharacterized protein n=1 Tax=Ascobolus immersus RN42 TaxID=1160509 RepID=A0A3N4HMQ0_ASCIM|nr:hypothetical protein BJ508DRAFT_24778 [Ascobolus immersus RN42]
MDIPYSRLEALKFVKARKVIAKKHPNSETLRLVDILLDKGKKLEGIKVDVPRQSAAAAASASLKRKPEDDANLSAAKKPTPHAPLIKAPQNVPKPSAPSAPIGLRPAGSATNVAPKQTTGFFKALKPVEKPAVTKPAQPLPSFKRQTAPPPPQQPSAPTTTFSSIFDQLKERQRKEEDAKSKQAADKAKPEEVKKVKKKKSVRWKMESELTEVKEFEVLEPEGEYYGGGSGMDHQWGDARSLDVSEGRDALNALKNRKMLEDEVDETIDWYQPIPLDTAEFYKRYPAGEKSPIKRFGKEMPKDDDAQVQKKREETVLAVLYFHEKDIPPSPAEPPEGETGIDEAPAYEPAPVVLPAASSGMPDLSKILAQFQQTAAASMAGANGPQKPAVSTPPVSTPAPAATASAPPKPEANPVDALLQSLAAMTQGAPPPPPPKIELPQFNIPPIPPPKPAEQPNPLASFLPGLLGGVSQPQQSAPPVAPDMAALFQSLNIPQPQGQQQQQQNNNILAGLLQTLNPAMASAWGQPQQQQYDYGQNMDWQRSRDDEDRGRNVREKVRERTGWSGDRDRDRDRDDHDKYGSSSNNNNNNNHRGNQGKHNFKDKKVRHHARWSKKPWTQKVNS